MEEFSEVEWIDERLEPLLKFSESKEEFTEQSYCPSEEARLKPPKSKLKEKRNKKAKARAETKLKIEKTIRNAGPPVTRYKTWTKEEQETLLDGLKKHGARAVLINKMLPHRSKIAIRCRIKVLKKRLANKKRAEVDEDLRPVLEGTNTHIYRRSLAEIEEFKNAVVQVGPKPVVLQKMFPSRT